MKPEFWVTSACKKLLDDTLPGLVEAVGRVATALEKNAAAIPPTAPPADVPASPFVDTEAHLFRTDINKVSGLCEECKVCLIPGALFPVASDGRTDHAYVERCDECQLFVDDVAAALAVAARLREEVEYSDVMDHPFVTGFTFEEAEKAAKKWNRDGRR
jgi:hypothetical protein